jgi:predicted transposase YbfD/YdcC
LVFAQVATEDKSNEITAIPILLEQIAIEGCIITIDAMGCQYEIVEKIVKKKADYVIGLKGNQKNLHDAVVEYWSMLDFNKPADQAGYIRFRSISTYDQKHGRKETRDYAVSDDVPWLVEQFPQWKSIKSIGMVESTRETGEGEAKTERRYFISSLEANENLFAHAVRVHWGIENRLHYILDVVYGEDASRVRKDNGPRTLALIRKIALTVARSDKESKTSIRGRVQQMGWSEEYLESLLFRSDFASVQKAS